MNNLIIIGNGFDLAHDMKTSYNHFIEYLVEEQCKSNKFEDMFTLGVDIKNIKDLMVGINGDSNLFIEQNFKNKFLYSLISEITTNNWCDIEHKYFEQLNKVAANRSLYRNPLDLNEHFEFIRKNLGNYLNTQGKEIIAIDSYKKMFTLIDSRETTILNFNYTDTLRKLYSSELKVSKVIHIHGELSNPMNPIIFGYAAMDDAARNLIDKHDNEYMRNIKKQLYKQTENEHLLSNYLNGSSKINVSILGHSCGISDELILNQILNHKNLNSICTYYFNNYEQYFQTQVNIDRIMKDDEKFRKLVIDFNTCISMPQYNNSNDQNEEFIDKYKILRQKQIDRLGKARTTNVMGPRVG